jgi:hypothetical protein
MPANPPSAKLLLPTPRPVPGVAAGVAPLPLHAASPPPRPPPRCCCCRSCCLSCSDSLCMCGQSGDQSSVDNLPPKRGLPLHCHKIRCKGANNESRLLCGAKASEGGERRVEAAGRFPRGSGPAPGAAYWPPRSSLAFARESPRLHRPDCTIRLTSRRFLKGCDRLGGRRGEERRGEDGGGVCFSTHN